MISFKNLFNRTEVKVALSNLMLLPICLVIFREDESQIDIMPSYASSRQDFIYTCLAAQGDTIDTLINF